MNETSEPAARKYQVLVAVSVEITESDPCQAGLMARLAVEQTLRSDEGGIWYEDARGSWGPVRVFEVMSSTGRPVA